MFRWRACSFIILALLWIAETLTCAETIRIGVIVPLSGPLAEYGVLQQRGIRTTAKMIPQALGKNIEIIFGDTQSLPELAIYAANKLIEEDKVVTLIDGLQSSAAMAVAPLMSRYRTPLLITSANAPNLTRDHAFNFRMNIVEADASLMAARFAWGSLNAGSAALVLDRTIDPGPFEEGFQQLGGKIIRKESIGVGEDIPLSLYQEIEKKRADVIYAELRPAEASRLLAGLRKARVVVPVVMGPWARFKNLSVYLDFDLKSLYFVDTGIVLKENKIAGQFVGLYQREYGEIPDKIASLAGDAYLLTMDALTRGQGISREAIYGALQKTENFRGITGVIKFFKDGNPVRSVSVFQIRQGAYHALQTCLSNEVFCNGKCCPQEKPNCCK